MQGVAKQLNRYPLLCVNTVLVSTLSPVQASCAHLYLCCACVGSNGNFPSNLLTHDSNTTHNKDMCFKYA